MMKVNKTTYELELTDEEIGAIRSALSIAHCEQKETGTMSRLESELNDLVGE